MAVQILRVAGPKPVGEQNGGFSWTVPLNAAPTREWLKFFNTPDESGSVCMPSLVSFHNRDMVFPAREDQITQWMEAIDLWMATANARVAVADERRGQTLELQERGTEAAKIRLLEADKYQNL